MKLRHATPARNLSSILKRGLLISKSKGKRKAVWLHVAAKTSWAVLHTIRRHGGSVEQIIVLDVNVPRRWLKRSKRGLWFCPRNIPPERIRDAVTFARLSDASAA
jgi:RNA:NAD 2'-phosphotransferase (TPT1/KptA family)